MRVMPLHIVVYVLPVLLVIMAIPLLIGLVPPNRWYGFRTPKTRSSREIWRKANRASASYLIAAVVLATAFNAFLLATRSGSPQHDLLPWMAGSIIVAILIAVLCSAAYLRRL